VQKLLDLRERIKTLHNIGAVTRTLATVSAAKLASSRRRATGLREYSRRMQEILFDQQAYLERRGVEIGALSPLLRPHDAVRRVAVLVITADRGMCGNYNLAICRMATELWRERQQAGQSVSFLCKGKKGERWFRKRGAEILHGAGWRRGGIEADEVEQLLALLVGEFLAGRVHEVHAAYTQFYSPLRRLPRIARLLPIVRQAAVPQPPAIDQWSYEPSFREVFEELLSVFLRLQLWDVLLESYSSEHGGRMITMEEATERAEKALSESRARYHRLRREAITIDLLGVLFASEVVGELGSPGQRGSR
jgi:F-type H+-transporting ATPase subunit gamma